MPEANETAVEVLLPCSFCGGRGYTNESEDGDFEALLKDYNRAARLIAIIRKRWAAVSAALNDVKGGMLGALKDAAGEMAATCNDPLAALASEAKPSGEGWKCFHCDDVFTDERCARLHFGRNEDMVVACQIKAGAEQGLLGALREAEYAAADAREDIATESSEASKAYYAQTTRHHQALRNAEELGYERGLADGRALARPAVLDDAVAAEREACLKVVEDRINMVVRNRRDRANDELADEVQYVGDQLYFAIRARASQPAGDA